MAGLRFLPAAVPTLLLALLAEFFRFLLLVVVCRAGSALARPAKTNRGNAKNIMHTDRERVRGTPRCVCACMRARQPLCARTWTSGSLGCRPKTVCFIFGVSEMSLSFGSLSHSRSRRASGSSVLNFTRRAVVILICKNKHKVNSLSPS